MIQLKDQAIQQQEQVIRYKEQVNQKLTYERPLLKRHKYGQRSEHLNLLQISMLDDIIGADMAGIETELDAIDSRTRTQKKSQLKRQSLLPELPRREVHHEPEIKTCSCGCAMSRMGEDVSEKLDYMSGVFTVERHIRDKWVCDACETLTQSPMPAHILDKGLPTAGLLAQVLIAKYDEPFTPISSITDL